MICQRKASNDAGSQHASLTIFGVVHSLVSYVLVDVAVCQDVLSAADEARQFSRIFAKVSMDFIMIVRIFTL